MTPIKILAKIITDTFIVGNDNSGNPIYVEPLRVVIENQNQFIAPTQGILVYISHDSKTTYGVAKAYKYDEPNDEFLETIDQAFISIFAIELYSRDSSAIELQDTLLLYLNSYKSEQIQYDYNVTIAPINSSWSSLGFLEGASRLNRFRISLSMYHGKQIISNANYFKEINLSTTTNL
tara:strand:+ start:3713 stop:4246 length:534 start_codon:yes stop_codon:yes gene_type:complete